MVLNPLTHLLQQIKQAGNSTASNATKPAISSIAGNNASAENATEALKSNNLTNPELKDETDAEKSSTALVNTTQTEEDLGNGTIRVKVSKMYRNRVKRYQRSGARQPDNDTLSVPAVENAKGPKDKIVDDKVVPIP